MYVSLIGFIQQLTQHSDELAFIEQSLNLVGICEFMTLYHFFIL